MKIEGQRQQDQGTHAQQWLRYPTLLENMVTKIRQIRQRQQIEFVAASKLTLLELERTKILRWADKIIS